jgi:hypothetical protein
MPSDETPGPARQPPPARPTSCPVCGAATPLQRVHAVASTNGARSAAARRNSDVVYMCANCAYQLDRGTLREREFVIVLGDLMQASGTYASVQIESSVRHPDGQSLRPDIVAKTAAAGKTVVVECRSAQVLSEHRQQDLVSQLRMYETAVSASSFVLALPARLTQTQKGEFANSGVEVWDLDEIARRFAAQLDGVTHPVLRPLLLSVAALSKPGAPASAETNLVRQLAELAPGREGWVAYQKLVGRILERLFCPPLSPPILERLDESGANRRDIILPNYAERGLWAFLRDRYCADYVVVDAKNYADPVGKVEALQVLNYLKSHGAGMLGFIVSRRGPDAGCDATIREQWAQHGKLLVVFSDEHVRRMLRTKEAGGPAEEVVRQWIEDFRLSM